MSRTINVAMAFDDKYVRYSLVAIHSILKNKRPGEIIAFYLLHNDISDNNLCYIKDTIEGYGCQLNMIKIERGRIAKDLPRVKGWPEEIYYRLLLPEIIGEDIERILYLDADIIVNESLMELFSLNLKENSLAGCEDYAPLEQFDENMSVRSLCSQNGKKYICSGVLLLDLVAMRRKGYSFDYYMTMSEPIRGRLKFPDQDIINYVHMNDMEILDRSKYNLFANKVYSDGIGYEKAKKAVIIHYAGYKPWRGGHIHYDTEKIWWEYAKGTPYYEEMTEQFILECLCDPFVYDNLMRLSDEKVKLMQELSDCREELKLRKELNEKLLAIVEGAGLS